MSRYFTVGRARPRANNDDERGEVMLFVPDVPEHVAADTGLVDHRGRPIFRSPNPIGFTWT